VANIIKEKHHLFKIYDKSKKSDSDRARVEENKRKYKNIKRVAKKAVHKAQEVKRRKFGEKLDEEDGKGNIFRIATQIMRKNRNVVGGDV